MAKVKGTKSYVTELNALVTKEYGEVPAKLMLLIRKTAQDMKVLDSIANQLSGMADFTTIEVGSMGQQKTQVTPLLPYYDKASARLTDDLYNLGLTARRQAVKDDGGASKEPDKLREALSDMNLL